jgi:hypothetical protein
MRDEGATLLVIGGLAAVLGYSVIRGKLSTKSGRSVGSDKVNDAFDEQTGMPTDTNLTGAPTLDSDGNRPSIPFLGIWDRVTETTQDLFSNYNSVNRSGDIPGSKATRAKSAGAIPKGRPLPPGPNQAKNPTGQKARKGGFTGKLGGVFTGIGKATKTTAKATGKAVRVAAPYAQPFVGFVPGGSIASAGVAAIRNVRASHPVVQRQVSGGNSARTVPGRSQGGANTMQVRNSLNPFSGQVRRAKTR